MLFMNPVVEIFRHFWFHLHGSQLSYLSLPLIDCFAFKACVKVGRISDLLLICYSESFF